MPRFDLRRPSRHHDGDSGALVVAEVVSSDSTRSSVPTAALGIGAAVLAAGVLWLVAGGNSNGPSTQPLTPGASVASSTATGTTGVLTGTSVAGNAPASTVIGGLSAGTSLTPFNSSPGGQSQGTSAASNATSGSAPITGAATSATTAPTTTLPAVRPLFTDALAVTHCTHAYNCGDLATYCRQFPPPPLGMPNFVGRYESSLLTSSELDDIRWYMYCNYGSTGIPGGVNYGYTSDPNKDGLVISQSISAGTLIPNPIRGIELWIVRFTNNPTGTVTYPTSTAFFPPLL